MRSMYRLAFTSHSFAFLARLPEAFPFFAISVYCGGLNWCDARLRASVVILYPQGRRLARREDSTIAYPLVRSAFAVNLSFHDSVQVLGRCKRSAEMRITR